jgi:hypothetical protein
MAHLSVKVGQFNRDSGSILSCRWDSSVGIYKTIVEHPFGTIKRWCDGSYLLLKSSLKATAYLSLSFLAYNMKRAINMVGIDSLITKIQTA